MKVGVWQAVAWVGVLAGCPAAVPPDADTPSAPVGPGNDEPLQPLPGMPPLDPAVVSLGARLYATQRLSADGTMSCETCHPLARMAVDGLAHSPVVGGGLTGTNTPTLYNVAFNFRFSWAGRQRTLEDQVEVALQRSMGTTAAAAVDRLRGDAEWIEAFSSTFSDGMTAANARRALADFQRSMVTPASRMDRWLGGDATALTPDELRGYRLFKELGCASCHQGRMVGGNMFQKMGVMDDYFAARGTPLEKADQGRFLETGQEADRHVFRVPSLRNVTLTAPYFHDGAAATLPDAIRRMGRFQLGRELDDATVGLLVAFLGTLSGEPRHGVGP